MKLLFFVLVVSLTACRQGPDFQSETRGFDGPTQEIVGFAAGYRVQKLEDGDVTCYVTEKIAYSGGGISCVVKVNDQ